MVCGKQTSQIIASPESIRNEQWDKFEPRAEPNIERGEPDDDLGADICGDSMSKESSYAAKLDKPLFRMQVKDLMVHSPRGLDGTWQGSLQRRSNLW